jgi:hypothetical protein
VSGEAGLCGSSSLSISAVDRTIIIVSRLSFPWCCQFPVGFSNHSCCCLLLSLTGTAILSEEGALLCCVAWEVSAACIVLIRAYCEKIDRSVRRRRAAGVSILCCFCRRCSYERLVSLRRCSLLCSGLSAIACTQQRSCSTRVYRSIPKHRRRWPWSIQIRRRQQRLIRRKHQ